MVLSTDVITLCHMIALCSYNYNYNYLITSLQICYIRLTLLQYANAISLIHFSLLECVVVLKRLILDLDNVYFGGLL